MEGLEIKEISFKEVAENKDGRIDTQFWTEKLFQNNKLKYSKIGDCLLSSQYGISVAMNEEGIGTPIYRMNEIHNMLCDLEVNKCAEITKEELENFKLNNADVLFNRTNSFEWVGRTGIYYKNSNDHKDYIFASYLVRFVPNPNLLLPEYLVSFLNTRFGIVEIKRRARQSINQTNVNPEEVKEIEIPLLSNALQLKIRSLISRAYEHIIKSKQKYSQAEISLIKELKLSTSSFSDKNVNIKSLSSSFLKSNRLDAEYYQPKFEEILNHIAGVNNDRLRNLVTIKKSVEPGSAAYQEEGIPFIRVSNLTKYGLTDPEIHLDRAEFSEIIKPKKNTVLLSKDGSVGIAYKVEKDLDCITSGAILHLSIKNKEKILPDYLTLVLNSVVVKMQAERDSGGSIIQHWKPSEIAEVLIPVLDMDVQLKISDLVQESFKLKNESERLLQVAKKAVEIAIEENEDTAMEFINKNC